VWEPCEDLIGAAVAGGRRVFVYYGRLARGHKVEPEQSGSCLARMKRYRYLSLAQATNEGRLVTRPSLPGGLLTVTPGPLGGRLPSRLLDPRGIRSNDLGAAGASPLEVASLAGEVRWPRPLERLRDRPVSPGVPATAGVSLRFEFPLIRGRRGLRSRRRCLLPGR